MLSFKYQFFLPSKKIIHLVEIDRKTMLMKIDKNLEKDDWMKLDFCKCSVCPLYASKHRYCPLALSTAGAIMEFRDKLSFDRVKVVVECNERVYLKETDIQSSLSSLMGLLMATSACPFFEKLKPMARFHLPFSSLEETIYRIISSFLVGKYFASPEEQDFELKDIVAVYSNLEKVNKDFLGRIRRAIVMDSSLNALVVLDAFAKIMFDSIENKMEEIRYLFTDDVK